MCRYSSWRYLKTLFNDGLPAVLLAVLESRSKILAVSESLYVRTGAVQVSWILQCGTALLGDRCPMFRDKMVVSSSRVKISISIAAGERPTSCPGRFTSSNGSQNALNTRLCGLQNRSGRSAGEKMSCTCRDSNPALSSP
jgi:hypothetical protein